MSCGSDPGDLDPRLSAPDVIQSVVSLYPRSTGRINPQYRLLGAQLRLRALPGVTTEWLAQTLKCHSARQTLGQLPELPNDPYWLPGSWVEIEARSDEDGFLVALRGENPDDAEKILARAIAYAGR